MDFGQSSPEDEDLYSTRSWATAVGGRLLPHSSPIYIQRKKKKRTQSSVNICFIHRRSRNPLSNLFILVCSAHSIPRQSSQNGWFCSISAVLQSQPSCLSRNLEPDTKIHPQVFFFTSFNPQMAEIFSICATWQYLASLFNESTEL